MTPSSSGIRSKTTWLDARQVKASILARNAAGATDIPHQYTWQSQELSPKQRGALIASPTHRVPWRRILYEPQPYPDNYVDDAFLQGLVANAGLAERQRSYCHLVKQTSLLVQRLSSIAIWVAVYLSLSHSDAWWQCIHLSEGSSAMTTSASLLSFLLEVCDAFPDVVTALTTGKSESNLLQGTGPFATILSGGAHAANWIAIKVRSLGAVQLVAGCLIMSISGTIAFALLRRAAYRAAGLTAPGPTETIRQTLQLTTTRLFTFATALSISVPLLTTLMSYISEEKIAFLAVLSCILHVCTFDYYEIPGDESPDLCRPRPTMVSPLEIRPVGPNQGNNAITSPSYVPDIPSASSSHATAAAEQQRDMSKLSEDCDDQVQTIVSGLSGTSLRQHTMRLPPRSPFEPSVDANMYSHYFIGFAAMLIASRLPSSDEVYAFFFFTFCLFVGWPKFDCAILLTSFALRKTESENASDDIRSRNLQYAKYLEYLHFGVHTFGGTVLATCALLAHSTRLAVSFVAITSIVALILPAVFLHLQRWKLELNGPWDYNDAGEAGAENI